MNRLKAATVLTVAGLCFGLTVAPPAQASATPKATSCPDVDVVFARGSGEPPGLGFVGAAFAASLSSDLPSDLVVNDYAVNYPASDLQLSVLEGADDMSDHIVDLAAQCPGTLFVIGGYSQGAMATDLATGLLPAPILVNTIPNSVASHVAAVVTFGNPGHLLIEIPLTDSPVYGPKWEDFCDPGDPVCLNGLNVNAHVDYVENGDAAAGAVFAAAQVLDAEG